ncbi:MAG: TlyA family RNA methyltransferase [bacterium]|nr:TlyA family RNA methyltransferase [bacterium]
MPKIRLDEFLLKKGYCSSIKDALGLILAGEVFKDGQRLDKPGILVDDGSIININIKKKYVSRGGEKLEKALDEFKPDIKDKIAIDVGASSGGFSDCLLKNGIKKIYCIDVGYGQLDWNLRNDPRVVLKEKTNIRYLKKEDFEDAIDLAVIDVSFISLKKVIPVVLDILKPDGEIIALIKPQFEVEAKNVKRGGVVIDENCRKEAVDGILDFAEKNNLKNKGVVTSPIKGPAGNVEYLCYLGKK